MIKAELDKWDKVCAAAEKHSYQALRVSTDFLRTILSHVDEQEEENMQLGEMNDELYAELERVATVGGAERIVELTGKISLGRFECSMCGEDEFGDFPKCGCEARINAELNDSGDWCLQNGNGCLGCGACAEPYDD